MKVQFKDNFYRSIGFYVDLVLAYVFTAIGAIVRSANILLIVFSCCPLSLAFSLISLACTGSEMIQSKKPKIIEMVILGFSI